RPFCEVTGAPFGHDMGDGILSAEAIADPPPYSRCRSAVLYDENVRSLVSGFKYSDRLDLGPWLANWMITAGQELFVSKPLLVPVPLYPLRLIGRRYNQSSELARQISKRTGLSFRPDILIRHRRTKQQVGLAARERERNVQGAFRVRDEMRAELVGRTVLLIDDVYTSGATVKAAARALKRGGSRNIDVLTFARVETIE
ncbi:MAG: ComF family protein, partial [Salaquimonas sp.]